MNHPMLQMEHECDAFEAERKEPRAEGQLLENQWWRPLMLRRGLIATTICLPILVIMVLETIHQVSVRNNNDIAFFESESTLANALTYTRFVPALIMLLISTMFNAIDFTIAVLALYTTMRKQKLSLSQAGISLLGEILIMALWKTVRRQLWPASLSALAALLGNLLTIIVAGLYTINPTAETQNMQLPRTSFFNGSRAVATIDTGTAAVLTSLLEGTNLSYPANTYLDLVFPRLDSETNSALNTLAPNSSFSVHIPALRSTLECVTLVDTAFTFLATYDAGQLQASAWVRGKVPLPQSCQLGAAIANVSSTTIDEIFSLTQNQSYIGGLLDLVVDLTDSLFVTGGMDPSISTRPVPSGCPSLAIIYGWADVNNSADTAATVLLCTQHIDTLDTFTFMTPKQTILNTSFSESSARRLSSSPNGNSNITSFPFSIRKPLDQSLALFNQTFLPTAYHTYPIDSFSQGVLFGKTALYPSNLTLLSSTDPQDRQTVFNSILAFYRRYMAQAISGSTIRQTTTAATDSSIKDVWNVTVYDNPFAYRVHQDETSKIILQVLLGLMVLMLSAACLMMDTREVVKMNPCSIMGKMVLLAGSRIVEVAGSEEGYEGLGERMVMLGWWSDGMGGRRWGLDFADEDEDGIVDEKANCRWEVGLVSGEKGKYGSR